MCNIFIQLPSIYSPFQLDIAADNIQGFVEKKEGEKWKNHIVKQG